MRFIFPGLLPAIGAIARNGGSTMASTRGKWLRSSLSALVILVAPASTSTVWAQGGFGADPFRPYNSQYDAYTYPMASTGYGSLCRRHAADGHSGREPVPRLSRRAGRVGQAERTVWDWYALLSVGGRSEFRPKRGPRIPTQWQGGSDLRAYAGSDHSKISRVFRRKGPQEASGAAQGLQPGSFRTSHVQCPPAAKTRRVRLEAATADNFGERKTPAPGREADALPGTADRRPAVVRRRVARVRTLPTDDGTRSGAGLIPPPPPLFPGGGNRGTIRRRRPSEVLDRSRRLNSGSEVRPELRWRYPGSQAPNQLDGRSHRRPPLE